MTLTNDIENLNEFSIRKHVVSKVSRILVTDETIDYIAVQQKPLLRRAPDCFVITNKRFIICHSKLLGGVELEEYTWRDLFDAKLNEGVFGASLSLQTIQGDILSLGSLSKAQARRLYAFAQAREEEMHEGHQAHHREEKKAATSDDLLPVAKPLSEPQPLSMAATPFSVEDPVELLRKQKEKRTHERQLAFEQAVAARIDIQITLLQDGLIDAEQAKAAMLQLTHEVSREYVGLMVDLMHQDLLPASDLEWIKGHWDDLSALSERHKRR